MTDYTAPLKNSIEYADARIREAEQTIDQQLAAIRHDLELIEKGFDDGSGIAGRAAKLEIALRELKMHKSNRMMFEKMLSDELLAK